MYVLSVEKGIQQSVCKICTQQHKIVEIQVQEILYVFS